VTRRCLRGRKKRTAKSLLVSIESRKKKESCALRTAKGAGTVQANEEEEKKEGRTFLTAAWKTKKTSS